MCSHQALTHSSCLLCGRHAVEAAQGKLSQVFLQAVATRELWEAAGSRGGQQKVVDNRKSWEAAGSRGRCVATRQHGRGGKNLKRQHSQAQSNITYRHPSVSCGAHSGSNSSPPLLDFSFPSQRVELAKPESKPRDLRNFTLARGWLAFFGIRYSYLAGTTLHEKRLGHFGKFEATRSSRRGRPFDPEKLLKSEALSDWTKFPHTDIFEASTFLEVCSLCQTWKRSVIDTFFQATVPRRLFLARPLHFSGHYIPILFLGTSHMWRFARESFLAKRSYLSKVARERKRPEKRKLR